MKRKNNNKTEREPWTSNKRKFITVLLDERQLSAVRGGNAEEVARFKVE